MVNRTGALQCEHLRSRHAPFGYSAMTDADTSSWLTCGLPFEAHVPCTRTNGIPPVVPNGTSITFTWKFGFVTDHSCGVWLRDLRRAKGRFTHEPTVSADVHVE